jgi:photosystem II stability/assembly factor-like uncharacterized protein
VSCASAHRCWAVGSTVGVGGGPNGAVVVATTDGGAVWTIQPIPTSVGFLSDISCGSVHDCAAVGQSGQTGDGPGVVIVTDDGGATWTIQPIPPGTTEVGTVACGTDLHCIAIAASGGRLVALVSIHPGVPWVAGGTLPGTATTATALACTADRDCWATLDSTGGAQSTGSVVRTTDDGTTWDPLPTPAGIGQLNDLSCVAPAVALPAVRPASTPPGAGTSAAPPRGTTVPGPPAPAALAGIGCVAVGTTSTAVDGARTGQGVVLTTSDGGATWTRPPASAVPADLLSVTCDAGPCVAVGSTVASSPLAGVVLLTPTAGTTPAAWLRATAVRVALPLAGVSCVSLSACVAVGVSMTAHLAGG